MEPKALLNADYLDIIYDNRNKTYGGYELRRNYNRRLKKAGGFVMLSAAAIFSFSFIAARHPDKVIPPNTTPTVISEVHIFPKTVLPKIMPPPGAACKDSYNYTAKNRGR